MIRMDPTMLVHRMLSLKNKAPNINVSTMSSVLTIENVPAGMKHSDHCSKHCVAKEKKPMQM